jgi:hypothetical protein
MLANPAKSNRRAVPLVTLGMTIEAAAVPSRPIGTLI